MTTYMKGPWFAGSNTKRQPQHPGEMRGPDGPVAYVSLVVPVEQRHATVSLLATAPEMLSKLIEVHILLVDQFGESEGTFALAALITKAKGEI